MKKYRIKDLITRERLTDIMTVIAIMAVWYISMWVAYIFQ